MKHCEKCGVNIRSIGKRCPLCQSRLSGDGDEAMYPHIATTFEIHKLFIKLLILGTVTLSAAAVVVNLILPQTGFWSSFVVLGVVCFWISFVMAYKRRNNLPKNITTQVVLISLLCFFWDYVTGWHNWSVDYVLPIACGVGMLALGILARVLNLPKGDYITCMVMDIVFGTVPLILFLCGKTIVAIPSLICAGLSVVAFAFILLFEGNDIREEIVRRLHI